MTTCNLRPDARVCVFVNRLPTIATKDTTMPRARAIWPFAAVLAATAVARDAVAADARGFLYGRVEATGGEVHTGFLRWGDQEVAWDDLFQSGKTALPHAADPAVPREPNEHKRVRFMGITIKSGHDGGAGSRVVAVRFGDLAAVVPRGEEKATLRLKNGTDLEVEGYADDVSADVVVIDPAGGETRLPWRSLASVTFLPVPAGATRGAQRLFGEVETDAGTFTGFVAWDKSLGLSTDLLEGEQDGEHVELAMGDIAAINRLGQRRCEVKLRDGRELTLHGTRHVARGNRGVLVEDARYGKVDVPWDAFDRLALRDPPDSGPGYADYPARGALSGTVVTTDGVSRTGQLVLDLDEAETWEMLNGSDRDVAFDIPLHRVAAIARHADDGSAVTLLGGETLELEAGQDVSDGNAGVLVLGAGGTAAHYIPWADVSEIRLASGH
jgi:hypothetical protein